MALDGQLSVGLFDLVHCGSLGDAEDLVELGVLDLLGWASTAAHSSHAWEVIIVHIAKGESVASWSSEEHFFIKFKFIITLRKRIKIIANAVFKSRSL